MKSETIIAMLSLEYGWPPASIKVRNTYSTRTHHEFVVHHETGDPVRPTLVKRIKIENHNVAQ